MTDEDSPRIGAATGSIDDVESQRSQKQRAVTNEQRFRWATRRVRVRDRRDCDRRLDHRDGDRDRYDSRCNIERSGRRSAYGRLSRLELSDLAAARGANLGVRSGILVMLRLRRAAARRPGLSIMSAPVPGRRSRHRGHEHDQGEQDEDDAAQLGWSLRGSPSKGNGRPYAPFDKHSVKLAASPTHLRGINI